jgi:hypothetical protein
MSPDCLEQLDLSRSDRGIRGEVHSEANDRGGHYEFRGADTGAHGDGFGPRPAGLRYCITRWRCVSRREPDGLQPPLLFLEEGS